ncbi:MAG: BREX system P-loop protein BrxC [Caldilineaceae bacterium]|nr:BREX system P-loop protein BrxC [Caldilineaceae bacterium]
MKIRETFSRDPLTTPIPNDGVAKVIQPQSEQEWDVLRYELESFVCDGEYRLGLERILSAFLTNISQPQQQAVWVSGFYGSGKSHLVRVLECLWRDEEFPDGVRPRSLVTLPSDIDANLVELSRLGRQEGGLWSAAGTLGAGASAVRLALLSILFKSADLPEQYPAARLALWLKQNGWYDDVEAAVESRNKTLGAEFRNMYVSPALAESLLEVVPNLAYSPSDVRTLLREQYPNVADISDFELYCAIDDVLSLQSTSPGKRPLTLLVFDELQQFIGNDPQRTLHVQNVVEACAARFGSHLLFVGTGQSALQANTELSKLQGRFSIPVTLSDIDVGKVVREVVLRKTPDKVAFVKKVLDASSGEIDRHLAGTKIGSQPKDVEERVADYPILPVRRRLWERMLRSVDSAGTAGQLRTQLRIVHDTVREVAEKPLGAVAPADAIFWQIETAMLQSAILPRDMETVIRELNDDTEDGKLRSRLCALIFMIGKLERGEGPLATGVRATSDVLADLMVDDLTTGSAPLRQKVPNVLQTLVDNATLISVDGEYQMQTPESIEWETDYRSRRSRILGDDVRMASERGRVVSKALTRALEGLAFVQGATKTPRKYETHFGSERPPTDGSSVPLWVQDEWSASQGSVREEARQAGVESPTVFVFLPRIEADKLRQTIGQFRAAEETVNSRALPQTSAGSEAKGAMQSRIELQEMEMVGLVNNIIKQARIYQGGGNEITAESFPEAIRQAVEAALTRLFPKFSDADQPAWNSVVKRAVQGNADPLSALGYASDVEKHPVCQEVRSYIGGAGKKGSNVRSHFSDPPYGWSRDAVDGALLALLAGGLLKATHSSETVTVKGMTQRQVESTTFFVEGVIVSATLRIEVRKLASEMGLSMTSGEEAEAVLEILECLQDEAQAAGGEAPLPEPPDTTPISQLREIAGNRQIVEVAKQAKTLIAYHKDWTAAGEAARERLPEWRRLERFLHHARNLPVATELDPQREAIRSQRTLLTDPNPIPPLLNQVTTALRKAATEAHGRLRQERDRAVGELETSEVWLQLEPQDRTRILETERLEPIPDLDVGADQTLMDSLEKASLHDWENQLLALRTRTDRAREEAARLQAPNARAFRPPQATLNSREEVEAYIRDLKEQLLAQVDKHPLIIQ